MEFLKGKKTYIIAILFLLAVIVPVAVGVQVPEWVYGVLASLGIVALRAAVADVSGNQGWRTYAAAIVVAGVSIAQALGVPLPLDLIFGICGALGLVGVRAAVEKMK